MSDKLREDRLRFVRHLRRNLEAFQADRRLERAGYKLLYVVDFAAIFAYVHRTFESTFIERLPKEDVEHHFARLQLALEVVFERPSRHLVLIPSYAIELTNHIQLLRQKYRFDAFDVRRDMELRLRETLVDFQLFQDFVRLIDKRASREEDLEWLRQMVLEFGKKRFPELYIAVQLIVIRALPKLARLVREGLIAPSVPNLFPNEESEPIPTAKEVNVWFERMNHVRNSLRPVQSYVDATACAYILDANRILNSSAKTVLLFFTPSRHVQASFSTESIEVLPDLRTSLVRDLDYFLLTLLPNTDGAHFESRLADLIAFARDLERAYSDETVGDMPSRMADRFLSEDQSWTEIENLLLAVERSAARPPELDPKKVTDQIFISVLNTLLRYAAEQPEALKEEINRLFEALENDAKELELVVPRLGSQAVHQFLSVRSRKNYAQFRFRGIPAEMPLTLVFYDEVVRDLAARLESARGKEDLYASLRDLVMCAAGNQKATGEQLLLAGCVSAMESKWKSAVEFLARAVTDDAESTRAESLFLLALIHRKLFESRQALERIQQALELRRKDPRFLIESANIWWLMWHQGGRPTDESRDDLFSKAFKDLANAETLASAGAEKRVQSDLFAQIWNLRTFLYTERAESDSDRAVEYLRQAQRVLRQLESRPEADWISRFFDTRGWFWFVKAQHISVPSQRLEALERARQDFAIALKDATLVAPKRALIEAHHDRVLSLLSRMRAELGDAYCSPGVTN